MLYIQHFLVFLITLYQKTLSPDHGWFRARYPYGFCRFHPSCSEYAKQALAKYGVFVGVYMAFRRVLRCNPFVSPRVDLP